MLPVAMLCGGKGTRIAEVADGLPKTLIAVVLLTGDRGDLIREFAGDGARFGCACAKTTTAATRAAPRARSPRRWCRRTKA